MKKQLLDQLHKVLDHEGNPKACGREECRKAIRLAGELFPGKDYGDEESGYMNVFNLFSLMRVLESDK
jgi:hypothetical protein